jgi:hypothetical protein
MRLHGVFALSALLCVPLSACHGSSHGSAAQPTSRPSFSSTDNLPSDSSLQPLSDRYGYVRMDTLMRAHPLAASLANLDRQIATLQAQLAMPRAAQDTADLRAAQKNLQGQLEQASARAQAALHDHGLALAAQERSLITALIAKQNGQTQAGHHNSDSSQNFNAAISNQQDSYQKQLQHDRQKAVQALAADINERDTRLYQSKVDSLHQQERDDALKLAQADSGERTSLQAKASNSRLNDADKKAVAASLSALDAKEDAQHKAEVAADGQLLAHLHDQLQSDSQKEFNSQVARLQSSSEAELRARGLVTQVQTAASTQPLPVPTQPPSNAALNAQIKRIHAQFQERFNADTRASVAAFKATHAQLQARFDTLVRERRNAEKNLVDELQRLQKQRDAMSARMTSQIQTETVSVAEHASIDVVLTNVLAQSHAVDLTNDVATQIARKK